MTLKEAVTVAGLSYRDMGKQLNMSRVAVWRLINEHEWPKRRSQDELKKKFIILLEERGISTDQFHFPKFGDPPSRTIQVSRSLGTRFGEKRLSALTVKEIDLMQLDRGVLGLFNLKANPFLNDVEAEEDVYPFKGFDNVASAIREAIEQRGFLAVTGESGSGKTTIWDGIANEYERRDDVVICSPQLKQKELLSPEHLCRALIYGLCGADAKIPSSAEARGRMLSAALRAVRTGPVDRKAVLYIDDAHFCNTSVLRQLKTFFEEKVGRYRLLAIILVGIPDLKPKLAAFPEIGNRIRILDVPPVSVEEYLNFKLRRIGSSREKLFDNGGWDAFLDRFRAPKRPALGRPLIINALCIRAMVQLHRNGATAGEKITREIIDQLPGGSRRAA